MRTHGGIMPPWYVESINLHASRPLWPGADGELMGKRERSAAGDGARPLIQALSTDGIQTGVNGVPSLSR